MPAYNAAGGTVGLQHGNSQTVWNAENPASGAGNASASQAVALPDPSFDKRRPFSVQTVFVAAPGAFEDDVQVSDVDTDASYVTITDPITGNVAGKVTAVDGTNQNYRVEFPNNLAKFVRVLARTQNANAVKKTTIITT